MMLNLFGSRITAEPEFISELRAVETEDRLRKYTASLLEAAGLEICDTNTPTEFAAAATVAIMKLVLGTTGRDFEGLSYENRFVTGLFGFLVAHNLSRRTNADLGVVLGIAGLDLFSREEIDQIYQLGSSYRRLRQHRQIHVVLKDIIDRFLSHPDEENLANLASVYELCLRKEN
jgi:hypothetical protein